MFKTNIRYNVIDKAIELYPAIRKECPACPIDSSIRESMAKAINTIYEVTVDDFDLEHWGAEFEVIAQQLLAQGK
jgi:hypothetical protein